MTILMLGVGAATCSRARSQTAKSPEQTAHQFAGTMLQAALVPAGARPYHGALPPILATSHDTPAVDNLVDEHRAWTVPQVAASLRNFKYAPPSHGFSGQSGAGSVETPDGKAWTFDAGFVQMPLNVALAQLNAAVADAPGGGSIIRLDALVSWTPPKTSAEYVPSADNTAIVSAMHPSSPPSVFRRVVITDPKRFAVLAAAFNRMRLAAVALLGECGASAVFVPDLGAYVPGSTIIEVAFSHDSASKPDLIVVMPGCLGVDVRAAGKLQPTLQTDDAFSHAVTDALASHA